MIKVTAFRWVPPFAQGFVRDLRIRWALEESGIPYEENLVSFDDLSTESYRKLQPFGQVPAFESDEVSLFESGAIVLHIADKSEALAPKDLKGKERARMWVIAALNSLEPFTQNYLQAKEFYADEQWSKLRLPALEKQLQSRLSDLSKWLGDKPYLEGNSFTVGDLVMATVLRELLGGDILNKTANLKKYCDHCLARPAFQKALKAQLDTFAKNAPNATYDSVK